MERLLVFSDTHGNISKAKKIVEQLPGVTGIIHLGDILRDVYALEKEFCDIPIYYVAGNNDYFSDVPTEKLLQICGFKIFITHGHKYISAFSGCDRLIYKGMEMNADIVLYGHTHMSVYKKEEGMIIANPGSLTYPRASEASYGVIEIEDGNIAYVNIAVEGFI